MIHNLQAIQELKKVIVLIEENNQESKLIKNQFQINLINYFKIKFQSLKDNNYQNIELMFDFMNLLIEFIKNKECLTIAKVALKLYVSISTVTRLCHALGFNFSDFHGTINFLKLGII